MDTVKLEGRGFTPLTAVGSRVTKGQKILTFDIEAIQKEGCSLLTPVLISNFSSFSDIIPTDAETVRVGEPIITIL